MNVRVTTVSLLAHQNHRSPRDAKFQQGDVLMFGPESRGLPAEFIESMPMEQRIRIPMMPEARSLNLSNAVAIIAFEAWRQMGFEARYNTNLSK